MTTHMHDNVPFRILFTKNPNFLYYRYLRKLQNMDPISIFFRLLNIEILKIFFHYRVSHKILLGSTIFFVFSFIFSKVIAKKLHFSLRGQQVWARFFLLNDWRK